MVGPLCFQLDQEIHGVSQESARISDAKKKPSSRLFMCNKTYDGIRCWPADSSSPLQPKPQGPGHASPSVGKLSETGGPHPGEHTLYWL